MLIGWDVTATGRTGFSWNCILCLTVKCTAFWLSVWKKWCLERGIVKEIKITSRSSSTLCSSDCTPKLKTSIVKPRKRRLHSIESDSDTDWTILELFGRTLNFFAPYRCENIIVYYCFYQTASRLGQFWKILKTLVQLILNSTWPHVITYTNRTRLFWPNVQVWINYFCIWCALCFCVIMISYLVFFQYIINK